MEEGEGEKDLTQTISSLIPGNDLGQLCHVMAAIHYLLCVG